MFEFVFALGLQVLNCECICELFVCVRWRMECGILEQLGSIAMLFSHLIPSMIKCVVLVWLVQVDNGSEEGDGLSLLDVVRHGVRTVVGVLEPRDRVAVVKYSSTASIVHRLLPMNASGKSVSEDQIQQLRPAGTTNLWEGLNLGLDVLREEKVQGRTQCLMLLTDGVPNVEPPRGHIPMLQRYLRRYGMMRECTINTFGFGYDLDSDLLRQIAFTGLGEICDYV